MGKDMPKIVCDKTINGVTTPKIITTTAGDQGNAVKVLTDAGQPFWWWSSITVPAGKKLYAVDFTNAPIATDNAADNNVLIQAITVSPEDVLTFIDI
jgi:hypothetical protein